jgi:hypothetical protein
MNCGGKKKGYKLGGAVCSKCGSKAGGCSCNQQKFAYGGMVNKKKK